MCYVNKTDQTFKTSPMPEFEATIITSACYLDLYVMYLRAILKCAICDGKKLSQEQFTQLIQQGYMVTVGYFSFKLTNTNGS